MELKIGDRVISKRPDKSTGCKGVITGIKSNTTFCYVKFDAPFSGHYGDPENRDKDDRSWSMALADLILENSVESPKPQNYQIWN